jgi:hypothetical protein
LFVFLGENKTFFFLRRNTLTQFLFLLFLVGKDNTTFQETFDEAKAFERKLGDHVEQEVEKIRTNPAEKLYFGISKAVEGAFYDEYGSRRVIQ